MSAGKSFLLFFLWYLSSLSVCFSLSVSVNIQVWTCRSLQSVQSFNPVHPAFICESAVRVESPCLPGLHLFLCGAVRGPRAWGGGGHDGSVCREAAAGGLQRALQGLYQVRSHAGVPPVLLCYGPRYIFRCISQCWSTAGNKEVAHCCFSNIYF